MNGVLNICPSASSLNVTVRVAVRSLLGVRLADNVQSGEIINFDMKARMEEKDRRSGRVVVGFALSVGTRPSVVKFEVEGAATLEGKNTEIDEMLEVDPETQVPFVFQRVYQHVFMSMYLLATLINAPCPPPNLLFSGQQQMPVVQIEEGVTTTEKETVQTSEVTAALEEEKTAQPTQTGIEPQEEAATPEKEQPVEAATKVQESEVVHQENKELSPEA